MAGSLKLFKGDENMKILNIYRKWTGKKTQLTAHEYRKGRWIFFRYTLCNFIRILNFTSKFWSVSKWEIKISKINTRVKRPRVLVN